MEAIIGDKKISIELENDVISVNGKLIEPDIKNIGENKFNVIKDHKVYDVEISKVDGKEYEVKVNGTLYPVALRDKLDLVLEKLGIDQKSQKQNDDIKAPMPGLILNVMANEGDEVKKGDSLFILEAMKMENVIKSPVDGVITEVTVSVGDSVDKSKILCKF
ncbi:MAG: biotin/lipoyl-containing protein [Bacteroidota bacterium]